MLSELDVLRIVSERLTRLDIDFMLTGSFAMAYYATPRMTRDLDLVIAIDADRVADFLEAFADDFYVDAQAIRDAVRTQRLFNLMHLESGIKVDMIVRKTAPFGQAEFARRVAVSLATVDTWVVSREDLILSKLVWAREGDSDLQRRDVRALLQGPVDNGYLLHWAEQLGVLGELKTCRT